MDWKIILIVLIIGAIIIINLNPSKTTKENVSMVGILKLIGMLVLVLGVVAGLLFWSDSDNKGIAISTFATGLISSVVFFGFAEIIHLLNQINDNLKNKM